MRGQPREAQPPTVNFDVYGAMLSSDCRYPDGYPGRDYKAGAELTTATNRFDVVGHDDYLNNGKMVGFRVPSKTP